MIAFKYLIVWMNGDSDWFQNHSESFDSFLEDRKKFFSELSCWSRVLVFVDKEIPHQQVCKYLGDFYRFDNRVEFVNALDL